MNATNATNATNTTLDDILGTHDNVPAQPVVQAASISSAAMIVELSISCWTGRKKDRKATDEVTTSHGAKIGVAAVNKKLLSDCAELDAIQKFAANVRSLHYTSTLPWMDTGPRLVSTERYFDYHNQMSGLQNEFARLVQSFLDSYEWEVTQAQASLGSLFNADEYPSVESLSNKFGFRLSYMPVPDVGDFRVDVGNLAQRQLAEQYAEHYNERLQMVTQHIFDRLGDTLTRFINSLDWREGEKAKKVYSSVFDTLRDLIALMGDCNFTNDPTMESVRVSLEQAMDGVSLEDLRTDSRVREETREELAAAIKQLPGLGW